LDEFMASFFLAQAAAVRLQALVRGWCCQRNVFQLWWCLSFRNTLLVNPAMNYSLMA
jgi:hypothetical protein